MKRILKVLDPILRKLMKSDVEWTMRTDVLSNSYDILITKPGTKFMTDVEEILINAEADWLKWQIRHLPCGKVYFISVTAKEE